MGGAKPTRTLPLLFHGGGCVSCLSSSCLDSMFLCWSCRHPRERMHTDTAHKHTRTHAHAHTHIHEHSPPPIYSHAHVLTHTPLLHPLCLGMRVLFLEAEIDD